MHEAIVFKLAYFSINYVTFNVSLSLYFVTTQILYYILYLHILIMIKSISQNLVYSTTPELATDLLLYCIFLMTHRHRNHF